MAADPRLDDLIASTRRVKMARKKRHRPQKRVVADRLRGAMPTDGTRQIGMGAQKIRVDTERNARQEIFERNQALARAAAAQDIAFEERRKALSKKTDEVCEDGTKPKDRKN